MTAAFKTLFRKAGSFHRKPLWSRVWLVPVWLMLGIAKALIFTISFRRLAPKLGVSVGVTPWIAQIDSVQEARALQIGRVVRLAAGYTPWNSNCFPQAVAARVLLGLYRIPYTLSFGLMRDPSTGEMKAHAWVSAGRVHVTGGAGFAHYAVVGCFVSPRLAYLAKA